AEVRRHDFDLAGRRERPSIGARKRQNADAFGLLIDGTIPKAVRERLEQARSEPAGHAGYQYAGLRHLKDRPRARKGRVFGASSYLAPWGVSSRHFESREPACRATPTRRVVPSRSSCSSKGMAC